MAPTKRSRNVALNQRTKELRAKIKKDGIELAKAGVKHISRKDAMRKWNLNEQDLAELEKDAVIAKRRREGLFYPEDVLEQFANFKNSELVIDDSMIPEAFVRKQITKTVKIVDYEQLRFHGLYGSRPGHKGRDTFFYKPEVLEDILDVKIIKEGDIFVPSKAVPPEVRSALPPPILTLKGFEKGPFLTAQPCYLGEVASKLVFDSVTRISRRGKGGRDLSEVVHHHEIFDDNSDNFIEEVRVDNIKDAGGSGDLIGNPHVHGKPIEEGRNIELLEDINTDDVEEPASFDEGFETSPRAGKVAGVNDDSFDSFDHQIDMRKLMEKFITE